jgi:hypothetical protein
MLELQRKTVGVAIGYGARRPRFVRIGMRLRDDQLLITTVIVSASISHRLTLEIVGIGVNRADVVPIVIAPVRTHALAVIFLLTRVLGLIAGVRELLTGTRETIVRAARIPLHLGLGGSERNG